MIIKRLTLNNFGIYEGNNTFEMTAKKPVVLIGGLNGCGKTTFLEAVLLALYGNSSPAYRDSDYSTYGNYLRAHSSKGAVGRESSVELEFVLSSGGEETTYCVCRSWNTKSARISQKTEVFRNGHLDSNLTNNWAMYVEDILPSALSGFFFFDGEKIAELVASDDENKQMKESVKALLGIDLVDSLQKDLNRLGTKIAKRSPTASQNSLEAILKEKKELELSLADIDSQIAEDNEKIIKLRKLKEEKLNEYASAGGEVFDHLQELNEQEEILINEIDDLDEDLVALSATAYPLLLLRENLDQALTGAREEYDASIFESAFTQIEDMLNGYIKANPSANIEGLAEYMRSSMAEKKRSSIYNPTALLLGQMEHLETEHFDALIAQYKKLSSAKGDRKRKLRAIADSLNVEMQTELIEEISSQIQKIEDEIEQIGIDIKVQERNRPTVNGEYLRCVSRYNKAFSEYIDEQDRYESDGRSTIYLDKVNRVLDTYKKRLQKLKVETLAKSITDCFRKLARKTDLITKVEIDSESLDFYYYGSAGEPVPHEILSAGERQLVVISTLWALSINSKERLPVIIDTPLARLDTKHRMALVKTYFPQASDQTIILSTDTEITGKCYERLKPNISEEYTLVYDDKKRSTCIKRGYFTKE